MPGLALAAHINFTLRHWHDFHSLINKIIIYVIYTAKALILLFRTFISRAGQNVEEGFSLREWEVISEKRVWQIVEYSTAQKISLYIKSIPDKSRLNSLHFFLLDFNLVMDSNFHTSEQLYFLKKRFNVSAWLIRYFNMCGLYFSLNYMLTILLKTITNKLKYFWQLRRVQKRRLANSIIILSGNCLKWCVGV